MFKKLRNNVGAIILIIILGLILIGATYVNVGPTTDFEGDVGVPSGSGYYINDVLFSTTGLIDVSALAKTDGGIIVGDGTNFVLETGATARASLGLTIGSDIQAYDDGLSSLAGLTYASDSFIKVTAEDTYAIRTLAETKADLDLEIGTDVQAYDAALTSISGLTYVSPSFIKLTANDTYAVRTIAEVIADLALDSDDLSDVASIAMLDENESIAGNWTVAGSIGGVDTTEFGYLADISAFGGSIIDDADEATFKATVNLEIGTDVLAEKTIGIADDNLLEVDDADAADDDYAKFTANGLEGRDASEAKTDLGFMTDVVDDTTPQLGGQLQSGAHSINFTEQVLTPGTAVAWDLGNSNKATLIPAQNFTITITAPSGALNAQLIVTQDGTGSRVMDEIITQADATVATTDVHDDTEIVDLTVDIPTGARIRIDNQEGTDVPLPLVENTIYWAIRTSENHIQFATTKANAIAGTNIDIADTGTGTHTVEQLVKWTGGTLGVLTTDAGAEDIMSLTYKTADKQWYAQIGNNFY